MTDDSLPTGWQKTDQPNDELTRYNPQPVTQYDHTETDTGIQLIPTDQQTGSASENGYRITVLSASTDSAGEIDLLTTAPDHEAALDVARRFMQIYNDRYVDGTERLDTILLEFSGPD
jgi:hypothetical protein